MVTFIVEKKSGTLPHLVWKKVFEREVSSEELAFVNLSSIANSLHHLFSGDEHRVVIICWSQIYSKIEI